jgi:hypothetical protein
MKGADEFCKVFKKSEQIGRLYLLPGNHARGPTFKIFVLPDGKEVTKNGQYNPPLNSNCVEVYGIISGQPGWTEVYGWKHTGKWVDDFNKIYANRLDLMTKQAEQKIIDADLAKDKKIEKVNSLLSNY